MRSIKTLISVVKRTLREENVLPDSGKVAIRTTEDCTSHLLLAILTRHLHNPHISFEIQPEGKINAQFLDQYCDQRLQAVLTNSEMGGDDHVYPFKSITREEIQALCTAFAITFDAQPSSTQLLKDIHQTSIHHGLQKSLETIQKNLNAK